jgi:pilus assembly protein CpaB
MDMKKVLLIVGAMIVALGAAFGVNQLMRGSAAPEARAAAAPEVEGPKVLVATRAMPVGTILTAESLRFQPWPEGLVRNDAYYVEGQADMNALVGSVVRIALPAGSPVTRGSLVNPNDRGFLAAALGPGMRAVTVPLSPDQGVGGFVFPGDRVDVIVSIEIQNEQDSNIKLFTSETIVRNLRVLAVDQNTNPGNGQGGTVTPTVAATVTLEATPQIAERIAVARSVGTISLSLRSLAENASELDEAIASGNVNVPRDGDARGERSMLRRAANRPQVGGSGRPMTGGDVSPHLRRTMPPRMLAPVTTSEPSNGGGSNNNSSSDAPSRPRANEAPVYEGPTVRIVRGDQVTTVPVR